MKKSDKEPMISRYKFIECIVRLSNKSWNTNKLRKGLGEYSLHKLYIEKKLYSKNCKWVCPSAPITIKP